MAEVVSILNERLKKSPIYYSVHLAHDKEGFSFQVMDVADSPADREAVAKDLERAAALLREVAE